MISPKPVRALLRIAAIATYLTWTERAARADMIMIDLHISNTEVAAAREAAKKRGEELVVVPSVPASVRHDLGDLQYELQRAEYRKGKNSKLLDALDEKDAANRGEIKRLKEKAKELAAEISGLNKKKNNIQAKLPELTSDMIRKAIQGIQAQHHPLTSLVISGHSNGLEFWGDRWGVTRDQLKGILDQYPQSRDSLRSVFMWGCYSAERGDIEWWKASLPKLKVIVGFSDVAPGAGTDASPHLLKDALTREAEMARQKSLKDTASVFRSLSDVNQTTAAAAINACYFGTKFAPVRLDSITDCPGAEQVLKTGHSFYSACFAAKTPCLNPPEDVHDSDLRRFYTDYLNYAHCAKESTFVAGLPPRERVLGLIFFANVRGNFAVFYKSEIKAANQALAKSGVAARFPDFATTGLTRQQMLKRIEEVRQTVESGGPALAGNAAVKAMLDRSETLLHRINCVPMLWMTEDPDPDRAPPAPGC